MNWAALKRSRARKSARLTAPLLRTEMKEVHGQLVEVKIYGQPDSLLDKAEGPSQKGAR